jgi:hypothetical protein
VTGAPYLVFMLLVAMVVTMLYDGGFFSVIPVFVIIPLLGASNFTEIDFQNRRYRKGTDFLGRKSGEWKVLPKIQYLSIIKRNTTRTTEDGIEYCSDFQLRFFVSQRQYLVVSNFNRVESARGEGDLIAIGLNEKLLDATVKPAKFIIE